MDETFKFYSKILDDMIEGSNFWANYFLAPYSFNDEVDNFYGDTTVCCGISRGALVNNDWNEVVKFDLAEHFCQNEVNIYKAAKEEGLEMCFAAVRYVGTYIKQVYIPVIHRDLENFAYDYKDDVETAIEDFGEYEHCTITLPLYAYDKVSHYIYGSTKITEEERNFYRRTNSPLVERCTAVGVELRRTWGDDIFWRLSDFCNAWEINDLHSGNVGWRGDKFVIMDYAGWHDEF